MGTRGFYAFKWHGRYYVFYNHWDSYPEGLGCKLVSTIPSEPAEYRAWLERKRAQYSEAEARLYNDFLRVSLERARSGQMLSLSAIGLENLDGIPSYSGNPIGGVWIEWVYIIDLDREEFYVSNDAYFGLSSIPSCSSWYTLLEGAAEVHNNARQEFDLAWPLNLPMVQPSHRIIVTGIRAQMDIPSTTESDYQALGVIIAQPKESGSLLKRPILAIARQVLDCFKLEFESMLEDVQHTALPHEPLFREVAFIAVSICSASPDLLRMKARVEQNKSTVGAPFGLFRPPSNSGKRPEFASSLFQGYHLDGYRSGSAESHSPYWLSGVLICLAAELSSEASIKAMVVQAVNAGKGDGRERFDAIITSIGHAVIVRVTKSRVQHTKRFRLLGVDQSDQANLAPNMSSWVDETIDAISAIAHVFEVAALDLYGLYASGPRGVFPNEVYKEIIEHVDPVARDSCLSVSRAFRDFASEIFPLDEKLFVGAAGYPELRCSSHTTSLGEFCLTPLSEDKDGFQWHPVIGHSDNTASFMLQNSLFVPSYDLASLVYQADLADEPVSNEPTFINSSKIDGVYDEMRCARGRFGEASAKPVDHDLTIFEQYLPSQSVIASAGDIMCLYGAVFFKILRIFGCGTAGSNPHWRSRAMEDIETVPSDVCMYVGRRGCLTELEYGLAWVKQPCKDTPEGWQQAIDEAKSAATTACVQSLYKAWLDGRDIRNDDFAVAVLIGSRCCFFHQGNLPTDHGIQPLANFEAISAKVNDPGRIRSRKGLSTHEFWVAAGISAADVADQVRQAWEPIHQGSGDGTVRPLNVHNAGDRAKLCEAFAWIESVAEGRGDDELGRYG